MNQKLRRHETRFEHLRDKINKKDLEIKGHESAIRKLKKDKFDVKTKTTEKLEEKWASKIETMKVANKDLESNIKALQTLTDDLTCQLADKPTPDDTIKTKDGKAYNLATRKSIYKALSCNVPVHQVSPLITYVTQALTGETCTKLPSPTTTAQMAYEMGVLTSIQLIHFVKGAKRLCLSWDATSIKGGHLNEVHVTANQTQHIYVDVKEIPGGRAEDYVTHIMSSFASAAAMYAKFSNEKEEDILALIYSKIKCTLTDRAPVNHKTTTDLDKLVNLQLEALDMHLLELNCNLHPLDTVASTTRTVLKV